MSTKKKTTAKKKSATKKKTAARTKTAGAAKKKASKKTTKKASPKQSSNAATKRMLVCANDTECFWTTDGQILASLIDLRDSLERMMDDVYAYHVTREKNDFADWVESVLNDVELGTALRRSRKPSSARTVVVRHLRYYDV